MNEKHIIASVTQVVMSLLEKECVSNHGHAVNLEVPKCTLLESDDEDLEFYFKHKQCNSFKKAVVTKHDTTIAAKCSPITALTIEEKEEDYNFDVLNMLEIQAFEAYLHMSKVTYVKIFQLMHVALESSEFTANLQLQQVYAISMWKLATNMSLTQIALKFYQPVGVCEEVVQKFCNVIAERFMPWPNSYDTQQSTLLSFPERMRQRFPCLFGIVAIKHLKVFSKQENAALPIVLQIICNGNKQIIDCCVELTKDYKFSLTPIGQMLSISKKTLPLNAYLVGGACCPLKKYLLCPFAAGSLRVEENLFNSALAQPLSMGAEVVESLTRRFSCLNALEAENMSDVRSMVETMCSLHNLCLESEDDYLERTHCMYASSCVSSEQETQLQGSEVDKEGVDTRLNLLKHLTNV